MYFSHPTAVIDEPCEIGDETKIWHFSHIMENCRIGSRCVIGQNVLISPQVSLGNGVHVQNNVSLYTGVVCEDDVFLGPSCVFTNVINPRSFIRRREEYRPTIIRKGASIGANSTILCGNTIGRYALVGAGSVVTHPVEAFSVVAGNPAHFIGHICRCGELFRFCGNLHICPVCGASYLQIEGEALLLKENTGEGKL